MTVKTIIVRFKKNCNREFIWSKKRQSQTTTSVSEDFPRDIAFRRRMLFHVFSKTRKIPETNKKTVGLKSDVLIINGQRQTVTVYTVR